VQRHIDTALGLGPSTTAQSSSRSTREMFVIHEEDEGDEDDVEVTHDDIGPSQLQDAP
jgi:hypothetical protein